MSDYFIENLNDKNPTSFSFKIKFEGVINGSAHERVLLENMLGNAWRIQKL